MSGSLPEMDLFFALAASFTSITLVNLVDVRRG